MIRTLLMLCLVGCTQLVASGDRPPPTPPEAPGPTDPSVPPPPTSPTGLIDYDPTVGTGEVRGLRITPADGSLTLRFLDAPNTVGYLACWAEAPAAPWTGHCEPATSPHTLDDLPIGPTLRVAVVPEQPGGLGPTVETHEARALAPERPLALHVAMEPADLTRLYTRNVYSDVLLPAFLYLGDEHGPQAAVQGVEGIRFRGGGSRGRPRKSFHIRLADRPVIPAFPDFNFRGDGRSASDRVLLLNTWADGSAARVALAWRMYEEVGIASPRTYPVDLWINGVYEGYYDAIERVDREALRRWGLNRSRGTFTLVRDRFRQHRDHPLIHETSFFRQSPEALGANDAERIAVLQHAFDVAGEVDDHDWQAILELGRWVHATPAGPLWHAGLAERFDLDHLVTVLALHELMSDSDAFLDDYWLYKDETGDGLWRIIPWDKDLTFGTRWYPGASTAAGFVNWDSEILWNNRNPLFFRTLNTPSIKALVDARAVELGATLFTPDWIEATLQELEDATAASMLTPPEPAFEVHPQQHAAYVGWHAWHVRAVGDILRSRIAWMAGPRADTTFHIVRLEPTDLTLDARGEAVLQGPGGWVFASLRGEPDATHRLSAEVIFDPNIDGIQARWRVTSHGAPFTGQLTLLYPNAPRLNQTWGHHWFGDEPLEVAGSRFELTLVDATDPEAARWLPTYVQPFSNRLGATLTLDGEHLLEARYRQPR